MGFTPLIVQAFYYSLGSGCIILFFVMSNFMVLVKTKILPMEVLEFLKTISASVPQSVFYAVIVGIMVFIGMVIEGIDEYFFEDYAEKWKKDKLCKKEKTEQGEWKVLRTENGAKKRTLIGEIYWQIFRKASVVEACTYYWKTTKEKSKDGKIPPNSRFSFMSDPNCDGSNTALWACAKLSVWKEKSKAVNRYRDLSFIVQLLRISFLCVALFSAIAFIVTAILWAFIMNVAWVYLGIFYLASLIVSLTICIITTPIAVNFSRRFIRDVGSSYNALMINKSMDSMNEAEEESDPDVNMVNETMSGLIGIDASE